MPYVAIVRSSSDCEPPAARRRRNSYRPRGIWWNCAAHWGPVIYCHCSMCRRASGSSFATNASVWAEGFRLLDGLQLIKEYESSPGNRRAFCSNCGSPLYKTFADIPSVRRVRLGTLDDTEGAKPIAHIWTGSKCDWFEINDGLVQFEEEPPESYFTPG
jgi:hypothetical protein